MDASAGASPTTRVVPLEAGAGPENPPCPACGEPLFGWLPERPWLRGPVRRCASCGLGVVGAPEDPEIVLRELNRVSGEHDSAIANLASFAASLGGPGWAGLGPGASYLFTVESVRRLVARRDQVVRARRALQASVLLSWQTLLNSVTFGHNVAFGALRWGKAARAKRPWQRRIDALATIVLALPALLLAIPIEAAGAAFGRGAVVMVQLELL